MARPTRPPSGREVRFAPEEIIVSKTDLEGRITYANEIFCRVSGYTEDELLGKPHNMIRHPAMPRCVFQLLWDTIQDGREIFAYVVNQAKNGDHYWVMAHVTPSFDAQGKILGYHSNRRVPCAVARAAVEPLYEQLIDIEKAGSDPKDGMRKATQALVDTLAEAGMEYDEFVFSLSPETREALAGGVGA